MKKLQKIMAIMLSMIMAASALSACSSAPADSSEESKSDSSSASSEAVDPNVDGDIVLNEPGVFPLTDGDPIELSIFTGIANDKFSEFDASKNSATAWVEDLLNVKLTWTAVTSADKVAKLNLIFQSNSYEDIIFGTSWDGATQYTYGTQGYLIPLNDYLENDAYYWNIYKELGLEAATFSQQNIDALTMPDGNIYSMGKGNSAYHSMYASRVYIYEPWLDAVGMDTPTTTDEFYEVLKAFKTQDPNGNGKDDEIPLTGSYNAWNANPITFLMNSFIYYDKSTGYYVDVEGDGKVHFDYLEDGFKTGMEYLAKLASEGLLSTDLFINDVTMLRSLTTQEDQQVGVVAGGSWPTFTAASSGVDGDWANFVALNPLEGPDGVQYAQYSDPTLSAGSHITNNCETPKAAFRFLDALYEKEIGLNTSLGIENVYGLLDEDTDKIGINGEKAKYIKYDVGDDLALNCGWGQIGSAAIAPPGWHSFQALSTDDYNLDIEAKLYTAAMAYTEFAPPAGTVLPQLIFGEDEADDVIDYKTDINTYVTEQISLMICDNIVEENWDAFIQGLEDRGINELLEIYQAAYEERIASFG